MENNVVGGRAHSVSTDRLLPLSAFIHVVRTFQQQFFYISFRDIASTTSSVDFNYSYRNIMQMYAEL